MPGTGSGRAGARHRLVSESGVLPTRQVPGTARERSGAWHRRYAIFEKRAAGPAAIVADMITKLSHVTLFVNNQEEAKKFYVNTLGFEVRTDHTMDGGFRWLTVGPTTQKDVEIVLMEPTAGPMLDEEAASAVRLLLKKGVLGSGVFEVDDCRKTYEELKAKGVQFAGPPEERFYGIEAIMKDGQGNWFSMTQHK